MCTRGLWVILVVGAAGLSGCANSSVDSLQSSLATGGKTLPATASTASTDASARTGHGAAGVVGSSRDVSVAAVTSRPASGTSHATPAARQEADALLTKAKNGPNAYRIGAQDVLEVSVFKAPELSKVVQVADNGTVNLPLVGEIATAGRTAQDVERDLTRMLGAKYLQNPQVTVFVKEYNSQIVTVEGAVKKPGVFPFRGKASLLQSLASAGGLEAVAGSEVIVFREVAGKRQVARFDVDAIRGGTAEDPPMQSGDVIVVATSQLKENLNNILKLVPLAGVFALL